MPDIIKISELDEALALADAAEFPYYQDNAGQNTTYKAPMTQIGAKIVEGLTYQGINLPAGAGNKTVENSLNYLIDAIGGDPNGNISDSYDPTAAYVKGDLCIYENALYICTAPTTGDFDPSKWTATTIDNVIGTLSTLATTVKSSIVGAVNELDSDKADKTQIADYVKIKYFVLNASDVTRNMDLSSNLSLDSGYKFLCYLPSILPDGFTTDQYLWLSAPQSIQGYPWWNTNPIAGAGTNAKLRFFYLEIRNIT